MKKTPLIWRLLGGFALAALFVISTVHPLLTSGESAAMVALSHLDKPYIFGAEGKDAYDCSGLVLDAFACFDVELIHSAKYIAYDSAYETVEEGQLLLPGDLVFFDTVRDSDPYDHVGLYLGMNRFVHASSSEGRVMISSFDAKWKDCYSGARRILRPCPYSSI